MSTGQETTGAPIVAGMADAMKAARGILMVERWNREDCTTYLVDNGPFIGSAYHRYTPAELRAMTVAVMVALRSGEGFSSVVRKVGT